MLTAKLFKSIPDVTHGFFTRKDGFSTGLYESLNCGLGSGDDRDAVLRNRAHCAQRLSVNADLLITVFQSHTAEVVTVTDPWDVEDAPVADAMVTNRKNVALAILAADCTPVLLVDPSAGVIGAAHAGWKGALHGILKQTVTAMTSLGAQTPSIMAAVGPCIGPQSYEVGPEFKQKFMDEDSGHARFFEDRGENGRPHFDLPSFVSNRLADEGVTKVERIKADTCAEGDLFFSYRRSCLSNEPDYGRQLSGIAMIA